MSKKNTDINTNNNDNNVDYGVKETKRPHNKWMQ